MSLETRAELGRRDSEDCKAVGWFSGVSPCRQHDAAVRDTISVGDGWVRAGLEAGVSMAWNVEHMVNACVHLLDSCSALACCVLLAASGDRGGVRRRLLGGEAGCCHVCRWCGGGRQGAVQR